MAMQQRLFPDWRLKPADKEVHAAPTKPVEQPSTLELFLANPEAMATYRAVRGTLYDT